MYRAVRFPSNEPVMYVTAVLVSVVGESGGKACCTTSSYKEKQPLRKMKPGGRVAVITASMKESAVQCMESRPTSWPSDWSPPR